MLKIVWDHNLPPYKEPTEIERWDKWFESVGLSKEWNVVKEQFPNDEKKQLLWAKILEINRISEITK